MKTLDYKLPDFTVNQFTGAAPSNWAMDIWKVDDLRKMGRGKDIRVAVLDTGCDEAHPLLKDRIILKKDFTGSRYGYSDRNGHGTHCLGTVGASDPNIGVAPECHLMCGKVLGDSGSGGDGGIADGIRWAVTNGADIISMSLGSSQPSDTIRSACDAATAAGKLLIVAAGNEGNAGIGYPGAFMSCISVAAIDRNFKVANFSSRGDKIDCSGPGVDITSCKPGGGLANMSGTSMATPFIAGMMALMLSIMKERKLTFPNTFSLRNLLDSRTVDLGAEGDDRDYGPGYVSPLMISLGLVPLPPPIVA